MSYQQAFVFKGNWNDDARKHPALRATEAIFNFFDGVDHGDRDDYYTKDWSLITPYGEKLNKEEWQRGAKEIYLDKYSAYRHVPYTCIVTDIEDGFDVYSTWNLYANSRGEAKGEKFRDEAGEAWDLRLPVFYRLEFVKVDGAGFDGLQIKHCHLIKDTKWASDIAKDGGVELKKRWFTIHNDHHTHMQHVK